MNALNFGFLKDFLSKGHERTVRAKKNIILSFFINGLNIVLGLALVPLLIQYLSPVKYGIWITLSTIIGWFGFFNIGLGNGLRNRFAEALAFGNHDLVKTYVSTSYAILSLIIGSILCLCYCLKPLLKWDKILNVSEKLGLSSELSIMASIVFICFCLQLILKLLVSVLQADQRPALASSFDLLSRIISLAFIFVCMKTRPGSLITIGIIMSGAPVLVLIFSTVWFYNGTYRIYRPSLDFIDFSKATDLLNLGIKFFIIQLAVVLLYQTNTIIISHLFGPAEVTPYSVAFKYFSIITMGCSIILSPFWSAFTEAWSKKEMFWIQSTMSKLFLIWLILSMGAVIMLFISPWVYELWVGKEIVVSQTMSMMIALWIILNAWNSIFSQFLNGIGKIKLQLIIGMGGALINVPLAVYLGYKMGICGVLAANIIVVLFGVIFYPIQYKKLMNCSAAGIWSE